jgi:hypothetical protein
LLAPANRLLSEQSNGKVSFLRMPRALDMADEIAEALRQSAESEDRKP